jgi:RND family efflux transporter MFP subunit
MINNIYSLFKGFRKTSNSLNKRYTAVIVVCVISFCVLIFYPNNLLTKFEVEVTRATAFPLSKKDMNESNFSFEKKGGLLFQASGWIEPDPFPIQVTSLYSGVVKEVHVLEGESVIKEQLLVSLIDEDAQLTVSEINAKLSQSIAEEAIIKADIALAKAGLESAKATVTKNRAFLQENNDTINRMESLPTGAVSDQELYRAKLALQRQEAVVLASNAEVSQKEAIIQKYAESLIAQQKTSEIFSIQKQRAELDLARTKIKAPSDGIVLRLLAKPGARMMLHMDDMDAAAAAILFEEGKLQARIDVPLSEAAQVNLGQVVEISSSILPDQTFNGKITRILGEADLQRNTLQVKVQILNPHPRLRPEMLCRAKFFGTSSTKQEEHSRLGIFVRKEAFDDQTASTSENFLWVISQDGKSCEKRNVSIGGVFEEKFIEVTTGLLPGEQVIMNPPLNLRTGDSVKVTKIL